MPAPLRLAALVAPVLLIGLAACGSPDPEPTPAPAVAASLPSIADVVEQVNPWVVSITTESLVRGIFTTFTAQQAGSGVIVRSDGYIATNNHVVNRARQIKVHLANGETYDARVVGQDPPPGDMAILKIDAEGLPVATFDESDGLRVGDWVISIGNALSLKGSPTVTLGIVSALGRTVATEGGTFYDMIQTDAAINTGSSGGPLVNLKGQIVGINQALLPRAQGVGFAQSAASAKRIIDSLVEHGRVMRPLIGLTGADVTPGIANELDLKVDQGVIVTQMSETGPAYRAGIRVRDVITELDGVLTPDMASFLKLLWSYAVGDIVDVEYLHENEQKTATVELVERPS
jgi:serine protease Do